MNTDKDIQTSRSVSVPLSVPSVVKIPMSASTYKESLTAAMTSLAADPRRVFIGYGLTTGRAMGTLKDVPAAQILETPVAENLMVGLAIGQSLAGKLPVVYFERADFLLNAMDAIVNHLNAIATLSRRTRQTTEVRGQRSDQSAPSAVLRPPSSEFSPAVILRITVGNKTKPLFTGPVHTHDFSEALGCMMGHEKVWRIEKGQDARELYAAAATLQACGQSTAIVEYKDFL